MHKKEKNILKPSDAARLTGGTKENLKADAPCGNADFKSGSNRNTLPENRADITTGSSRSFLPGNNTGVKTGQVYSDLSGKLYLLILVGLSVAVLLMLAGFGLDFFNGAGSLSLDSLQEHALNPAGLIDAIKNNQMPASQLISYAGLLAIILVPAAGLIYIIGYFTHRKKYNLALTAAGVLFILILSAVTGLLKS